MPKSLILLFLLIPTFVFAQQPEIAVKSIDSSKVGREEIESKYPGGADGWRNYLVRNMHYPPKAIKKRVQGTVMVRFSIDEKGRVGEIEAVEGPLMLTEESVRLIRESGKWIPARLDGKPVKSYKNQPFNFRLEM